MSHAAQLHLHYSLDNSLPIRAVEGVLRIKGWCFAEGGGGGLQVKLQAGALTLFAPATGRRDDVAAAFPQIPHAGTSGFEISGHVPPGLFVAELWAGREGFGWQRLLSFSVYAEAAVLHGAIDLPLEKEITSNIRVEGWCFHPQREIVELWLHYGSCRVRCVHYGHERKDVASQFPHLPQARVSGFSSEAVLNPGEGRIRLKAVDRDGGEFYCETQHVVKLKATPSIHTSVDSRLDGRALFQAFASRQSTLPALRLILPFSGSDAIDRVLKPLAGLPSDNWSAIVLAPPTADLTALAKKNPHVSVASSPSTDPSAWNLRLEAGDVPNIHGLVAAWLAVEEHPELDAVVGDFTEGAEGKLAAQPPWSSHLTLSGGVHPRSPALIRASLSLEQTEFPVISLASNRAKVVHVPAVLVHRANRTPVKFETVLPALQKARPTAIVTKGEQPERIIFSPGSTFRRPTVTAIVLGPSTALPPLKESFAGSIDHWSAAETLAALNSVVKNAADTHLIFLTPGCAPLADSLVKTLAMYLESNPDSAVSPLLLQPGLAPWSNTDYFTSRTLRTLSSFDPQYAWWTDRSLTLFSRETAYVSLPGLFIARQRLLELGGIDPTFESITGALLDLSFRLRAAGTPPALCAEARLIAHSNNALSAFEETLLLDRWDRNEINPLRIRPLVKTEVMA